ncbi:MAG: hypothetical protein IJ179_02565 [Oscillospiraceae bacterium]|nr:hypothetical protein [Clostridia bacterium]MBQ9249231.1 hypothetical protein [Oscillospiraceae bacterium]MBR1643880.1 hypothetical protein [Bacteroidales bacterium]
MKKLIALILAALLLLSSAALASDKYDLDNFGYRTVKTRGQEKLVFQSRPRGSFMSEYSFSDGDRIFVNLDWREDGYAIAYENGDYGYVDASYIDWGGDSRGGDDVHDLDNFVYRTVEIDNGGALVFQRTPRGTFMYDHRFYDGDEIFVNEYYRESGYALAYEGGSYGYVDVRYIDWDDGDDDDDDWDDSVHDLDNFEYRTVEIDNGGALVFQRTPRGEFMYKYKFYDGDRIFVNVDYRERGYALAYKNGVYGYVDAGYIDW